MFKFKQTILALGLGVGLSLGLASPSSALIIDGSGNVSDWGLTPQLGSANNSYSQLSNDIFSTRANNYAPIDYPGLGYTPSGGEPWDLEEMHVRFTSSALQVLTVASSPMSFNSGGNQFRLGDLFLTVGGYRFGMITQNSTAGLTPGSIYQIASNSDLIKLDSVASYLGYSNIVANDYGPNDTVENIAGPWAVGSSINPAQLVGSGTISTGSFSYGGAEDATNFIEYTINLSPSILAQLNGQSFLAKQTISCGNDVIQVGGVVPEPASLGLVVVGATMMLWRRRRPVADQA
jgi:hypothetical protein